MALQPTLLLYLMPDNLSQKLSQFFADSAKYISTFQCYSRQFRLFLSPNDSGRFLLRSWKLWFKYLLLKPRKRARIDLVERRLFFTTFCGFRKAHPLISIFIDYTDHGLNFHLNTLQLNPEVALQPTLLLYLMPDNLNLIH